MRRIYPFKNAMARGSWATPKHSQYPIPCVIGQKSTKKGKEVVKWVAVGGDIGLEKDRTKATVCKTQKVTEDLLGWIGGYGGFRGTFVEPF